MKKLVLIVAVAFITTQAFTQNSITPTALGHAKELLNAMGTMKASKQIVETMVASYKQSIPGVPTEFWDEFRKEFTTDGLIDLLAPIYAKYYTDEELLQLIAFYKSPLGQKLTEKLPAISQESFVVGQEWGKKIGEKVTNQLKEKGYMKD